MNPKISQILDQVGHRIVHIGKFALAEKDETLASYIVQEATKEARKKFAQVEKLLKAPQKMRDAITLLQDTITLLEENADAVNKAAQSGIFYIIRFKTWEKSSGSDVVRVAMNVLHILYVTYDKYDLEEQVWQTGTNLREVEDYDLDATIFRLQLAIEYLSEFTDEQFVEFEESNGTKLP